MPVLISCIVCFAVVDIIGREYADMVAKESVELFADMVAKKSVELFQKVHWICGTLLLSQVSRIGS